MPARRKTGKARNARRPAPQCAALRPDGSKCRRKAANGTRYCSSHAGYRPKGTARKVLGALKKARGMKAIRARAKRTRGGKGRIRNRPAARKLLGR